MQIQEDNFKTGGQSLGSVLGADLRWAGTAAQAFPTADSFPDVRLAGYTCPRIS